MLLRSLSAYYVPDDIDSLTNTKSTCDCENGGTCILGAFCACPVAYTGRYCDTPVYTSCAIFKEYDIIETDCVLCICINSLLVCDVLPFGLCRHKRDNNQHLYRTKLIEIALNSIQQRFSQIRSFISAEKKNVFYNGRKIDLFGYEIIVSNANSLSRCSILFVICTVIHSFLS